MPDRVERVNDGLVSACAKSLAEAKRSAGSLASAFSTAHATLTGTVDCIMWSGLGSLVISLAIIACALVPLCGGSPASISYVTAPSE
jgi:hypothetical protein